MPSLAKTRLFATLLCLALPASLSAAPSEPLRVIWIPDADTIHVISPAQNKVKVRFAGIDCPESDQPWGKESTAFLQQRIRGQSVTLEITETDRYGRAIARVYHQGENLNRWLVQHGHCWTYSRYAKGTELFELEAEAKRQGLGLWALPEPDRIPPWEWRRR
ncbi:thermonuclease family protein [Ferrimonas marina]|uniref:Endonuclease YncB, thermonuclease family n=1 Tax=Ferrimonas marina TaxID=299255 RepID=A0A1M5TTX8_9GAMM|nr:thermonuclease family protein [Ferrimonas marina]SHH54184.1 Endonuclease YncB, thermonuclease family [Ferrimonas marina]